ncbi:MAG TPA: glycosyltransferase family 4 protein [Syntrophales bacterium]|nr:glycosyltransferase family 4 protein [Syntrophales bacterium]
MEMSARTIAVVIPKYGLVGGGEKFALELTERIAASGRYNVHVFANRWIAGSDRIAFHKVPIVAFPKFLTTISFARFAGREMGKMKFDLIHSHDRIFRADVFTMHSVPHRFWVREIRKKRMSLFDYGTAWVEKQLINSGSCKKYLPVSTLTKEKFLQEYAVDVDKVQIISPGVDLNRFSRPDRLRCRQEVRRRFGLGEEDTVILFVSMNFELKGLHHLMAALARIKAAQPSAKLKLLVVGRGNERKYGTIARKYGVAGDVIFTGVWKEDIERVYLASDIFSILSKFDTFGMVVLEAMSASLPVIISGTVGAKDLVRDGENGYVVEREDIPAIASRIEKLMQDRVRSAMAKEAYEEATSHTWDRMAEKVLNVYDELLGA